MNRNVEIKAKLSDEQFEHVRETSVRLTGTEPQILKQTDTFFCCPNGRLKLRQFGDGSAELIFYQRPDLAGPKTSSFERTPCPAPETMLAALGSALGIAGTVCKQRSLFLFQQTRIHLDEVDGLGKFLELEVVLDPSESAESGHAIVGELMHELQLSSADLVEGAYVDLLR